MRTSLPDNNTCNWRATNQAGFASALVNAEIILEITTPVDPINAGAIASNPFLQHRADTFEQKLSLLQGEIICRCERMQLRQIERLIDIDISKPSNEGLVEQEWF